MCVWRISKDITYDVYNFICYRRVLLPVWIKLNLLFKRNKFYFKGLKLFFGLIISIQKNHLEKFSAVKSRFFFSLRGKCSYSEFFWSVFSRIQFECGEIRTWKNLNTDNFQRCPPPPPPNMNHFVPAPHLIGGLSITRYWRRKVLVIPLYLLKVIWA